MKLWIGSLLGLVAFGLSSADAQFYSRPITNPLEPQFFNPYNPYMYYGNPAARGPGTVGPGFMGGGQTGAVTTITPDLTDPTITGHATRFFDYSRYFFNQGGSITPGTGTGTGTGATGFGATQGQQSPSIGTAPQRPKTGTKTGS